MTKMNGKPLENGASSSPRFLCRKHKVDQIFVLPHQWEKDYR